MKRLILVLLPALFLSGCMLNGGGFIQGTGSGNAQFGFAYADCDPDVTTTCFGPNRFQGFYLDPRASGFSLPGGVRMKFTSVGIQDPGGPSCIVAHPTYVSQNRNYPNLGGSQVAFVNACDVSEPNRGSDTLRVLVLSGPYAGYDSGTQPVIGGNLSFRP